MMAGFEDSAPANIALIKYMGKKLAQQDSSSNADSSANNQPANSSLSWTLENLRTFVRITSLPQATQDQWQPLSLPVMDAGAATTADSSLKLQLSEQGQQRFLKHFDFLKKRWGLQGHFLIESANNFPSDCGLASSASSFAALTRAAVKVLQESKSQNLSVDVSQLAELSRCGSGSSCRSFFSPWACWDQQGARAVDLPSGELLHQVVIVSADKKEVSSSWAHQRVLTSPLFAGRVERAEQRLQDLLAALKSMDWRKAYQLCWDEFQDMHALFSTSVPAFSYLSDESQKVLDWAQSYWSEHHDGPLVTMDAGPNVHFLWRADQTLAAQTALSVLSKRWKVFSSQKGRA